MTLMKRKSVFLILALFGVALVALVFIVRSRIYWYDAKCLPGSQGDSADSRPNTLLLSLRSEPRTQESAQLL